MGHMDFIRSIFVRFVFQNNLEHFTDHTLHLGCSMFCVGYGNIYEGAELPSVYFITNTYRIFSVLCWLWNIYEKVELSRVYIS